MDCRDYLPLLSGHLDGANSELEERRLQQHLQSCKHCREFLLELEQADFLLKESKAAPPAELTARIMEQVRKEPKLRPRRRRYFAISATAVTAAALLGFAVFSGLHLPDSAKSGSSEALPEDTPFSADQMFSQTVSNSSEPANAAPSATPNSSAEMTDEAFDQVDQLESTADQGETTSYGQMQGLPFLYSHAGGAQDDSSLPHKSGQGKPDAPLLVIWSAKPSDLTALQDVEPISYEAVPEDVVPTGKRSTLYDHLLAAISLADTITDDAQQAETPFLFTHYVVSYETMCELFLDSAGTFETVAYYPAQIDELDACAVLIVEYAQTSSDPAE